MTAILLTVTGPRGGAGSHLQADDFEVDRSPGGTVRLRARGRDGSAMTLYLDDAQAARLATQLREQVGGA